MAHKSKKQWYLRKEVGKLQVCQGAGEENGKWLARARWQLWGLRLREMRLEALLHV